MKLLIANRGEIAVRIMRACRELDVRTVAVYSDCDRTAPFVHHADEAYAIGPGPAVDSYLRIDRILDVAQRAHADAVHPGYGFLAENAAFAAACEAAGLLYIGPTAGVIARMGSKTAARAAAVAAGVPVVPGTEEPLPASLSDDALSTIASAIGYPLIVKAVAGGGGKGMRTVADRADLAAAIRAAQSEAASAFGESAVYLERMLARPRHVEIQLLGDHHGRVLPFVERECSIQRRHQKLLEESPSPAVSRALRERLAEAAAAVARCVGYTNAGTIEFLLDDDGSFYFLEMNTRLQVEHPITELVSGTDLVHWQLRIARGERLTIDAERALEPRGHGIECRIYAEDPDNGFLPSPGRITALRAPSGPGVRDDSGVEAGYDVPIYYDSMISKLCAWGEDRLQATARMRRALSEYRVSGIKTTIPFFHWLLDQPAFLEARVDTTFLDRVLASPREKPFVETAAATEDVAVLAAAIAAIQQRESAGVLRGVQATGLWQRAARLEAVTPLIHADHTKRGRTAAVIAARPHVRRT